MSGEEMENAGTIAGRDLRAVGSEPGGGRPPGASHKSVKKGRELPDKTRGCHLSTLQLDRSSRNTPESGQEALTMQGLDPKGC